LSQPDIDIPKHRRLAARDYDGVEFPALRALDLVNAPRNEASP